MFQNYYPEDDKKCILCNGYSDKGPMCKICYDEFKSFVYDIRNDCDSTDEWQLDTTKNLYYDTLQLFAYLDEMEKEGLVAEQTEFLINFGKRIKEALIKNKNQQTINSKIFEEKDKIIKKLKKELSENEKIIKELDSELNEQCIDFDDPRKKWPTKYRCKDGHYVRSRAEKIIDDWLFSENILHVYEKQVLFKNGEKALCDFYLPKYKTYIEFWGRDDKYYTERKREKTDNYKKDKLTLLSLEDKDLQNLDDILEEALFEKED